MNRQLGQQVRKHPFWKFLDCNTLLRILQNDVLTLFSVACVIHMHATLSHTYIFNKTIKFYLTYFSFQSFMDNRWILSYTVTVRIMSVDMVHQIQTYFDLKRKSFKNCDKFASIHQ